MKNGLVTYESADGVATITLARAERKNALNNALVADLNEAWRRLRDGEDRVAVLTSSDPDYFCVGADVKDLPAAMWQAIPNAGVELVKPVIAAVSGWVVGGGFVLVQMCDMCVAAEGTRFLYPEAKVGTTGGLASSVIGRLPHKVAMEFLLTGEALPAQRAYDLGFVNRLVPRGEEKNAALALARAVAEGAPLVVQTLKRLADQALGQGPVEAMLASRRLLDVVATSEDRKEGVAAFKEKRKPRFSGR